MFRRSLLALPAVLAAARVSAQPARLPVAASFSILGDMAAKVGGERIALAVIVGADVDAHGFQPRPSDAVALRGARLILRNGLGFDDWMDRLVRSSGTRGTVVTATQGITPRMMEAHHHHGHDHSHGQGSQRRGTPQRVPDPHAWQDLRHGQTYLRTIADALAAADPDGAETYRRNAAAFLDRLDALDAWVRGEVATVPQARRRVVTSHDAFGYFGDAYGVAFFSPQGVSTKAEPSAQQVARLIRQIRAENITAVFMENMTNPATLRRIAAEAGVAVGGRLYADALSAPGGPAPDYEAMFRYNVGLLVPAMRGAA